MARRLYERKPLTADRLAAIDVLVRYGGQKMDDLARAHGITRRQLQIEMKAWRERNGVRT